MSLEKVSEKIQELKDNITATKSDFVVAFDSLFTENEDLEYIKFSVYTPSFNDGSPCVPSFEEESLKFGMKKNEKYVHYQVELTDNEEYEIDENIYECVFKKDSSWKDALVSLENSYTQISEFVEKNPDLISEWFEDNITLTFFRDGKVDKTDYSCGW